MEERGSFAIAVAGTCEAVSRNRRVSRRIHGSPTTHTMNSRSHCLIEISSTRLVIDHRQKLGQGEGIETQTMELTFLFSNKSVIQCKLYRLCYHFATMRPLILRCVMFNTLRWQG
ncbi:uncharacterized protein LOC143181818 isoform X3 [Calliopsis andreniformis]|uniref:uncharacterized protein LOC143181818 isoform X3 n=1 Tax=Calliopsis andreniformis TaxID=337506 RepID=UPI003FCEC55A